MAFEIRKLALVAALVALICVVSGEIRKGDVDVGSLSTQEIEEQLQVYLTIAMRTE